MQPIQDLLPNLTVIERAQNAVFLSCPRESACDPACEICGGTGYYRLDVPIYDARFGKVFPCPNAQKLAVQRMKESGHLDSRLGITANELRDLNWRCVRKKSPAYPHLDRLKNLYQIGHGMGTLLGSFGRGKTTLLKIFVVTAITDGRTAAYANASTMLDDIRLAYNSQDAMGELLERMDWWSRLDVLCLDEMDKVNTTPWAEERLFRLLDARYELAISGKALTLIAANYETTDPFPGYLRSRLEDELFQKYIIRLEGWDLRTRRSTI